MTTLAGDRERDGAGAETDVAAARQVFGVERAQRPQSDPPDRGVRPAADPSGSTTLSVISCLAICKGLAPSASRVATPSWSAGAREHEVAT